MHSYGFKRKLATQKNLQRHRAQHYPCSRNAQTKSSKVGGKAKQVGERAQAQRGTGKEKCITEANERGREEIVTQKKGRGRKAKEGGIK